MKLLTSLEKYTKYVIKQNFKYGYPFSKELFAVEMGKTKIEMNKPMYLGQAIFDLNQMIMYEFHNDSMHPKYEGKINLFYMNTGNLLHERDMIFRVIKFDASGNLKDNNRPLPIKTIEKVINMMEDDLDGKIMTKFVALRAKMYTYRKIDKKLEDKRYKGPKKCVVAERLTFADFNTCFFDGKTIYREQMLFENLKNEVYMVNKYKIPLNRDEDNRLVQANGITTLTRGYLA